MSRSLCEHTARAHIPPSPPVLAVNGDRERYAPAYMRSVDMIHVSERFRLKALACEQFSLDATDRAIKAAWTEIAIEWHTLSNRAAQEFDRLSTR
jgi:hypothetical protein